MPPMRPETDTDSDLSCIRMGQPRAVSNKISTRSHSQGPSMSLDQRHAYILYPLMKDYYTC
jgi:hypothetical protein